MFKLKPHRSLSLSKSRLKDGRQGTTLHEKMTVRRAAASPPNTRLQTPYPLSASTSVVSPDPMIVPISILASPLKFISLFNKAEWTAATGAITNPNELITMIGRTISCSKNVATNGDTNTASRNKIIPTPTPAQKADDRCPS